MSTASKCRRTCRAGMASVVSPPARTISMEQASRSRWRGTFRNTPSRCSWRMLRKPTTHLDLQVEEDRPACKQGSLRANRRSDYFNDPRRKASSGLAPRSTRHQAGGVPAVNGGLVPAAITPRCRARVSGARPLGPIVSLRKPDSRVSMPRSRPASVSSARGCRGQALHIGGDGRRERLRSSIVVSSSSPATCSGCKACLRGGCRARCHRRSRHQRGFDRRAAGRSAASF